MSPKITSKSLSYDSSLPPFLQRLRAENTSGSTAAPRPKRAPNPDADEEDEPVYVDEEGAALDDDELHSLGVTKKAAKKGEEAAEEAKPEAVGEPERKEEKIAAIGAARKRKVGKVVGAPEEEEGKVSDAPGKDKQAPPQKKKKVKKVKLSFGDDE
ncbi:hypothetical protein VC83_07221 [Pseudogymnoascus destructans]|uniref:DUF4604 domain-containing protein n=2 Tax=Pseudogymnoascus destructans TaxID=655981 RepID=L8GCY4_PSED2|nr:uncharacterized protein VC83_07221 [Pseudogymnoascus destructans]ELR09941.1 hypothetical protein GMDG_04417 [Pseudogymnoascus destructans 20631-21]OAF56545.1 hypothetical protein VC83_07221 [Pseudogymnoascus destructans]